MGARLDLDPADLPALFGESPSRYVLEIEDESALDDLPPDVPRAVIGQLDSSGALRLPGLDAPVADLAAAWETPHPPTDTEPAR